MEELETLEVRSSALQKQRKDLLATAPTYKGEASNYAKKFIKDHFGLDVDPDHTYLNIFTPSNVKNQDWLTGITHDPDHSQTPHSVGTLTQSVSLTDLFINNFPADFDPGMLDPSAGKYGIYASNDPHQVYPPAGILDLKKLYNVMRYGNDFVGAYEKSLDNWFKARGDKYTRLAEDNAQIQADLQYKTDHLSEQDYQLASAGFNAKGHGNGRNISVYPVMIGAYRSKDMLRIVDNDSGRNLLYIPGDKLPVRGFNNAGKAWNWLTDSHGTPDAADAFAEAHFSRNDATGRSNGFVPGVSRLLQDAAAYHENMRRPIVGGEYSINVDSFGETEAITPDPFGHVTGIAAQGVKDDARYDITSNDDVSKTRRLSWTKYIPVIGGLDEAIEGKTPEVRGEGALSALTDLFTFVMGPEEKAGEAIAETAAKKEEQDILTEEGEQMLPAGLEARKLPSSKTSSLSSGVYRYLHEAKAAHSDGLAAYRSPLTLPAGAKPNAQGMYDINGKRYVTLKRDITQGKALYEAQKVDDHYELRKPGQSTAWNAPWLKRNEDGSFSAMRGALQGGGRLTERVFGPDMAEMRKRLDTWGSGEIAAGTSRDQVIIAKTAIEQALSSRAPRLDLHGLGLRSLPEDVLKKLTWLKQLDLSGNSLTQLPSNIDKLKQLTKLNVSSNPHLASLPETLGNLKNLETLDASHGALRSLAPNSFDRLKHLKNVDLSYNHLEKIPPSLARNSSIESLDLSHNEIANFTHDFEKAENLKDLDLSNNSILHLGHTDAGRFEPIDFSKFKSLERLDLSHNNMASLPHSFGDLPNLKILHLEENGLTVLPNTFGRLQNLEVLNLKNNELSRFIPTDSAHKPMKLRSLDLSGNRLGTLNTWVFELPQGSRVNYANNPIVQIPLASNIQNSQIDLTIDAPTRSALRRELDNIQQRNPDLALHRIEQVQEERLQEIINSIFPDNTGESWAQGWSNLQERYTDDFATTLERIMNTREGTVNPDQMKERIRNLLTAMKNHPDLRQRIFDTAEDTVGHCGDRLQLGFSRMEMQADDYLMEHGLIPDQDVGKKIIGKFNLSIIHQLVAEKIAANPGLANEELEVELAYTTRLRREGINLPSNDQHMQFERLTRLTDEDIEQAKQRILASDNSPEMISFISENESWQSLLKRHYKKQYDDAMAPFNERWDALEEMHAPDRKPGQAEDDYRREKQLWENDYEEKVRIWQSERSEAEKSLFERLTRQELLLPEPSGQ